MQWRLTIELHLPHQRVMLGWEFIEPDDTCEYASAVVYLLFVTFTLDLQR